MSRLARTSCGEQLDSSLAQNAQPGVGGGGGGEWAGSLHKNCGFCLKEGNKEGI